MKIRHRFKGAYPVLLTPFDQQFEIDWSAYRTMLEWYLKKGVGGLFANALTSEMAHLTPTERLRVTREAVQVANGMVPVVATGSFGNSIAEHLDFCKRVADEGVDAVILTIPEFCQDEPSLETYYMTVAQKLPGVNLGIYECPYPRPRHLSPELVRRLAVSGRFLPFKETSCDLNLIQAKISAAKDTPLVLLQANTPYLLDAIRLGATGIMGLSVNVVPEFTAYAVDHALEEDYSEKTCTAHAVACEIDLMIRALHPAISKYMLLLRGLPIDPRCRSNPTPLSAEWRAGIRYALERILSGSGNQLIREKINPVSVN
ncbi:MAG TPA: dihydrodipicolinate synthase family protein [Anaerolineaceae bacterium]